MADSEEGTNGRPNGRPLGRVKRNLRRKFAAAIPERESASCLRRGRGRHADCVAKRLTLSTKRRHAPVPRCDVHIDAGSAGVSGTFAFEREIVMRFVSTLFALSVAASATLLAGNARADNWSGFFKIALLETHSNGGFVIHVTADTLPNNATNNPAGCPNGIPTGFMWKYSYYTSGNPYDTAEFREQVRQMLMSAYLSGRRVSLYVDSNGGTCGLSGDFSSAYNHIRVWD